MTADREFSFNQKDFSFLSSLVKEQVGIVLNERKYDMVYSRLARRLRQLKMTDFRDYCALLQSNGGSDELANLINSITTNLTHFFREEHHFEHLRDEVLRPMFTSPSEDKRLRIWSSACSSGAEPYSIAMVLDKMGSLASGWDCKILATDIDSNMLQTGKRGVYPKEMAERIPPDYRSYAKASPKSDTVDMPMSLKQKITFNQLNLIEGSWPMKGPMDVIFCRNVVIYFDKPTQRILFDRLADILKPDGWLYIGHSENLHQVSDRFRLEGRTMYRRIR